MVASSIPYEVDVDVGEVLGTRAMSIQGWKREFSDCDLEEEWWSRIENGAGIEGSYRGVGL